MTDFIKKENLDTEPTFGAVGQPVFHDGVSNFIKGNNGGQEFIKVKDADVTNSDTSLNITASEVDRGAQFAHPNVNQDRAAGPAGAFDNGHTR